MSTADCFPLPLTLRLRENRCSTVLIVSYDDQETKDFVVRRAIYRKGNDKRQPQRFAKALRELADALDGGKGT